MISLIFIVLFTTVGIGSLMYSFFSTSVYWLLLGALNILLALAAWFYYEFKGKRINCFSCKESVPKDAVRCSKCHIDYPKSYNESQMTPDEIIQEYTELFYEGLNFATGLKYWFLFLFVWQIYLSYVFWIGKYSSYGQLMLDKSILIEGFDFERGSILCFITFWSFSVFFYMFYCFNKEVFNIFNSKNLINYFGKETYKFNSEIKYENYYYLGILAPIVYCFRNLGYFKFFLYCLMILIGVDFFTFNGICHLLLNLDYKENFLYLFLKIFAFFSIFAPYFFCWKLIELYLLKR